MTEAAQSVEQAEKVSPVAQEIADTGKNALYKKPDYKDIHDALHGRATGSVYGEWVDAMDRIGKAYWPRPNLWTSVLKFAGGTVGVVTGVPATIVDAVWNAVVMPIIPIEDPVGNILKYTAKGVELVGTAPRVGFELIKQRITGKPITVLR